MIKIPGVAKSKVAVFGLGATGVATCEALVASGAEVFSWDEAKPARARTENTAYAASHPRDWPWAELAFLALSPGVPLTLPEPHVIVRKARHEGVEVLGDIELFARAIDAIDEAARPRVIAVTGSNGKSTTTALIGHILKEAGCTAHVGGNIGEPLLALPAPGEDAVYVLELSSFQLDLTTGFHANTAVFLNLAEDHLDRHGDMARYAAAKKRIFRGRRNGDLAVVCVDDPYGQAICAELSAGSAGDVAPVSAKGALGRGVFALNGRLYYRLNDKVGEAGDIGGVDALKGEHNAQNASAALAAVMAEGVAPAVAVRAMGRFGGLRHRLETVGRKGNVTFVNDSKATNAAAAATALKAYTDIFWIAGGKRKSDGVAALRPLMNNVRAAYLIGEGARALEADLAGAASCFQCGDLDAAFARAARDAAESGLENATVLLSPACASHDQFANFEARGERFREHYRQFAADPLDQNGRNDKSGRPSEERNGAAA